MISEKYILALIREFAKTDAGKEEIKKAMSGKKFDARYQIDGIPQKTKKQMLAIGEKMKSILFDHINGSSSKVIESFNIDDIIVNPPVMQPDGRYKIEIGFNEEALHRKSLQPGLYRDGVRNIIKLFVTGYTAGGAVKGVWEGHGDEEIWSLRHRDPNDFMAKAVDEFNSKYSGRIAHAELYNEYQGIKS